jgi:hypothetical protein
VDALEGDRDVLGELGAEFDREAAKERPFRMAEPPHLRRPGGSVTNW